MLNDTRHTSFKINENPNNMNYSDLDNGFSHSSLKLQNYKSFVEKTEEVGTILFLFLIKKKFKFKYFIFFLLIFKSSVQIGKNLNKITEYFK